AEQSFHRLYAQRRIGGDLLGPSHRFVHQLIVRDDPVDQSQFDGAVGRDVIADETDFACAGPSDEPRQEPCAAAFGHDAAPGKCGSKLRAIAHQPKIASEREIESIAGGGSVDRAYDGGVDAMEGDGGNFEGAQMSGAAAEGAAYSAPGRGVLEIESGAESPALAGQDYRSDIAVAIVFNEAAAKLGQHLGADRVHPIGSIELENRDVSVLFDNQVGHWQSSP